MKPKQVLSSIIIMVFASLLFSSCGISQDDYDFAANESYKEGFNDGYDKGIKDTYKVYQLNGSYECISVYATPLQDLPATEENVFFIDECLMSIENGNFTMWDNYGDYSFGPAKVAPDDSPYDFIVYAPAYNEETGETIDENLIIAYIDKVDHFTLDMIYTEEGNNDYFTNIIARFEKIND